MTVLFKWTRIVLKTSITLYLRNNPMVFLVIPEGFVFYVAMDEVPRVVEGVLTELYDLLPAEYRASSWDNKIIPVSVWVSKSLLDEAIAWAAEADPVL